METKKIKYHAEKRRQLFEQIKLKSKKKFPNKLSKSKIFFILICLDETPFSD